MKPSVLGEDEEDEEEEAWCGEREKVVFQFRNLQVVECLLYMNKVHRCDVFAPIITLLTSLRPHQFLLPVVTQLEARIPMNA